VVAWTWLAAKLPPSSLLTLLPSLSSFLLRGTGARRLTGQDKDREITYQLLLQAKQTQLSKINLLPVNVFLFIY